MAPLIPWCGGTFFLEQIVAVSMEDVFKLASAVGLILGWFLASQALGEFIIQYYFIIETISLLLIFGITYEAWTSSGGGEDFLETTVFAGGQSSRTEAQLFLLFAVTSLVLFSMLVREMVQNTFGQLAVVQLLAIVAVISRMFVNVRFTGTLGGILDGERSTYMVYSTGVLAIVLSFLLRPRFPPTSVNHNGSVIFLATIIPAIYFYAVSDGENLPSFVSETRKKGKRYVPRRNR